MKNIEKNTETRIEKDSMGELKVPKDALYGAQTQRAIDNFPISGITIPHSFIKTLGLIKGAAAKVNADLKLLKPDIAKAIMDAADSVIEGQYDAEFPLDIFQTGSGTSSNMNANEVIARLASLKTNLSIHPNDHVNMSQSSNDVIPTAIHVSCSLDVKNMLLPALHHLHKTILERAKNLENTVKTGRTHLMDAMPLTFGQELSGWATQIQHNITRVTETLTRLHALAIGGTAVGTGINAHPEFGKRVSMELSNKTQIPFTPHTNYFMALSSQDTIVELSGHLRVIAISLSKMANDLRLMNSGPLAGFNEIVLPSLQPGSSIMPGKINPVVPEAVLMAAAQVIGNDTTISIAGLSGNFQLNTMLPVIAYNILLSIKLMSNSAIALADKAIAGFVINQEHIEQQLSLNPILVTALNAIIGYEKGASIAKRAYREKRSIKAVAAEMTNLSPAELDKLLDPKTLTKGGIEKQ
ncbi:MAG: class II fumarate hydratase [Gammaproteobacteria bacterium]|jgi:fumarate hydratase class II|nr:class II fumarate hydratase [Gammaproteobacteria bacterium]